MPNAHVAAAVTGLPGMTLMPAEALSIREAVALRDGLGTLQGVIAGLMCQPRFQGSKLHTYNAPGSFLEDLAKELGEEMARLVKVIRASSPCDSFEAGERAEFLAIYEIENGGSIADALTAPFLPPHA